MPVILPRTFVICSSLLNTTSLLFLLSATRQFSSSSEVRPRDNFQFLHQYYNESDECTNDKQYLEKALTKLTAPSRTMSKLRSSTCGSVELSEAGAEVAAAPRLALVHADLDQAVAGGIRDDHLVLAGGRHSGVEEQHLGA